MFAMKGKVSLHLNNINKFKLSKYGKRYFQHSAAALRNGLPRELRLVTYNVSKVKSKILLFSHF